MRFKASALITTLACAVTLISSQQVFSEEEYPVISPMVPSTVESVVFKARGDAFGNLSLADTYFNSPILERRYERFVSVVLSEEDANAYLEMLKANSGDSQKKAEMLREFSNRIKEIKTLVEAGRTDSAVKLAKSVNLSANDRAYLRLLKDDKDFGKYIDLWEEAENLRSNLGPSPSREAVIQLEKKDLELLELKNKALSFSKAQESAKFSAALPTVSEKQSGVGMKLASESGGSNVGILKSKP